jgi:hypothetical protein
MKVTDTRNTDRQYDLESASPGSPIVFRRPFHANNCRDGDVFIVCQVVSCYRPKNQYNDKIGVVNIRNGNLSYVEGDRQVEMLNVECKITERC